MKPLRVSSFREGFVEGLQVYKGVERSWDVQPHMSSFTSGSGFALGFKAIFWVLGLVRAQGYI